ncbi:GTPase Era [Corynebacterium kalinowskii]|uniref:GTPase Era n=1 Tax=Corynebacterium kalinowskii TaxID=2675216 RepID=A0A6B8VTF1_9CORY|nr:dynamin family protein [Corynebacterium kalinowskii]QGU02877.1 GTPase Era [Corynebacterium kalinowskii]
MIEHSIATVTELRDLLNDSSFTLDPEAQHTADALARQIDDYVLPRLANVDAPLLAVIGGSTGSGKSTLVNAVVGQQVSLSGAIRPTTRQPVLVTNPQDEAWFASSEVLPGLARERGEAAANPTATTLRTVTTDHIQPGLALLDAPDFDSIDDGNRALASQLLAAADLWIFVTTPARYADQLVWNFLHDAASRDIEVIVVLNRVDEEAMKTVPEDLKRMMSDAGLGGAKLITVPYIEHLSGLLAPELVSELSQHLEVLAGDAAARRDMALKTVDGVLAQIAGKVEKLAATKEREEDFADQLDDAIDGVYLRGRDEVIAATQDGNLLRKEVMQRWQDFVGTSDAFRTVERWYSVAVDRIGSFFTGKPAPVREVETEIEAGLHAVIVDAAETAAARSWSHLGSVAPELRASASPVLAHASTNISDETAQLVRDWQASLMNSIQDSAGDKRMKARLMSFGLNVVTVALMLVVFASTAGLTGGEVAIAGGSAVLGQKMLETIFGEEAVRKMAKQARQDLDERIEDLFLTERDRYREITDVLDAGTDADELRAAVKAGA